MLAYLKMVIDPGAWLAAGAATFVVGVSVASPATPDPLLEWTGIPMGVVLGGLLGSLIGQSFLPAATLWRGVLAVSGGTGLATIGEPHITAALSHYFTWWPRLPFAHAAFLGLVAPTLVPMIVTGVPALWERWFGGKEGSKP